MSWGWCELYGMFPPPGSLVSAGDGPVTPAGLTERDSSGSPPCGRAATSRRPAGTRQEWSLTRDSVATSRSSTWTASGHRARPGARIPPLRLPIRREPAHGAATAAATTRPRSAADSPSGFSRAGAPAPGSRGPTGPSSSGSPRRAGGAPAGVVCTQATHHRARDPAPAPIPPAARRREGPGPFYPGAGPPRRRSPDAAERRARPRAPEAPVSQALWRHDEKQRRRVQGSSEGPLSRHQLGSVSHQAAEHRPWRPDSSPEGGPRRRLEEVTRENGGDFVAAPHGQVAARTSAPEGGKPKKRVHWRRRQANW